MSGPWGAVACFVLVGAGLLPFRAIGMIWAGWTSCRDSMLCGDTANCDSGDYYANGCPGGEKRSGRSSGSRYATARGGFSALPDRAWHRDSEV